MSPAVPVIVTVIAAVTIIWFYLSGQGGQFDGAPIGDYVDIGAASNIFVFNFAHAIAKAEGFGIPNAIPTRAHNPGDLVIPGWTGAKLGENISVFDSDLEGWNRLYHQLQLIIDGASRVYTLNDTIASMASKWTKTNQAAWAATVASELNATPDVPLLYLLTVPPLGPSDGSIT